MASNALPKEPSPFVFLDLKKFCRPGVTTTVDVVFRGQSKPWLKLGASQLAPQNAHIWSFGARLGRGATDDEDDSAWAVRFDLIGVRLDVVYDGRITITGWIGGDWSDGFCIPPPGWDPFKDAETCDRPNCTPKGHPIVKYSPEGNPNLFSVLRGCRVEIVISVDGSEEA